MGLVVSSSLGSSRLNLNVDLLTNAPNPIHVIYDGFLLMIFHSLKHKFVGMLIRFSNDRMLNACSACSSQFKTKFYFFIYSLAKDMKTRKCYFANNSWSLFLLFPYMLSDVAVF